MPNIIKLGCSEYRAFFLCDDKKVYASVWDGSVAASRCLPYPPIGCLDVYGGQYIGICLDKDGIPYTLNNQTVAATKYATESTGQPFSGNSACYAYMNTLITLKNGDVYMWGPNDYKMPGVSASLPTKVTAGLGIIKLVPGSTLLGMDKAGTVYEWTNGNAVPRKVPLPGSANDIWGSYQNFRGALIGGQAYGWGNMAFYGFSGTITAPISLGWPYKIVKIVASWNTIHFIDDKGNLYGMGDNSQGEVGIGTEWVNHAEQAPNPYVWDWAVLPSNGRYLLSPKLIGNGFTDLFGSNSWVFYHYAMKGTVVYSWGRQKSVVLGNGLAVSNESDFPNALDVLTPTQVTPLTPWTKPVTFVPYKLTVTDQSITGDKGTLNASGSPSTGYTIKDWKWTQLSGPSTATLIQGAEYSNVSGLVAGNYRFRVQMIDNNGATISKEFGVVVAIPNEAPVASIAAPDSITLPDNSMTLDGSASKDPDGTIASYLWSQVSGPTAALLGAPTAAKCAVNQLTEGQYVFQLMVSDNKGASGTATKNVLVKPQPVIVKVDTEPGLRATITKSDGNVLILQ